MKSNINKRTSSVEQELATPSSFSGVEIERGEGDFVEPFDPKSISIESKVISIDTVIRRLLNGQLRLAPNFQRKEIWDTKRKSQLIESLMMRIPLPMFYVAADTDGCWDVVDGLQRLSTIRDFVLGQKYLKERNEKDRGHGHKLQDLEFWGEKLNGKDFAHLPDKHVNTILETEFRFTIINPGTPEVVKFNVFKRINTGGLQLTAQEIRHALYQGHSTELLTKLVASKEFIAATDNSVNDSRMAGRELILRFLAFTIRDYRDYDGKDLDVFLADTMRIINLMPDMDNSKIGKIFKGTKTPKFKITNLDLLEKRFIKAMVRAKKLFGVHAFRKSLRHYKRSPINKSLFEAWSTILGHIDDESFEQLMRNKEVFFDMYENMIYDDTFYKMMSRDSWKKASVKNRHEILSNLINHVIAIKEKEQE